ncbi:MAG: hypothetical protein QMC67_12835 [Candidatus Wallbacteria bacterium]
MKSIKMDFKIARPAMNENSLSFKAVKYGISIIPFLYFIFSMYSYYDYKGEIYDANLKISALQSKINQHEKALKNNTVRAGGMFSGESAEIAISDEVKTKISKLKESLKNSQSSLTSRKTNDTEIVNDILKIRRNIPEILSVKNFNINFGSLTGSFFITVKNMNALSAFIEQLKKIKWVESVFINNEYAETRTNTPAASGSNLNGVSARVIIKIKGDEIFER